MTELGYKTLRESIVDIIRKRIINRELQPGQKIVEQELAKEFQTSRAPIREALRELENEGLVEYVRNAGCSVKEITFEESFEIYLMRANYEIMAVRLLGGKIPEETLQEMEEILERMKNLDVDEYDQLFSYDNKFHSCLIRMTGMKSLYKAWKSLNYGNIVTGYNLASDKKAVITRQYPIHKELLEACKSRKKEEICRVLSDHYMSTIHRLLKEQGMTSIIISHKLNEISYVADKITVIRDGSTIETLDKKVDDFSEQRIIQGMVGREMTDRFPKRPDVRVGAVSMEVKNWTVYHPLYSERKVVDNVSFKIHKGEVVGISGLMGAGRTELAMSIFGKSYGTKISGQIFMNGKEVKLNTVQEAIDNKLAYVTEDRKGNGLILSKSIKMNTSLANMKGISNGQVIDADKEYAVAEEYRKKLKTKCPSVEQNVGNLSGGNQQKVLLAKWMFAEPDILILDEPTRGIDVGAKYEIYCIINDLVAAGKSVIMISSELPEVLGMSDRIYIMNEGKFVGEVSKEEATSELIMSKIVKSGKGA